MINVQDVVKWYGPMLAVDHVSFQVKQGEVLGFLGPNGAGKSTTMRMLTGYLPLSGGKVEIGGFDIEEKPLEAKALFGYLPENAPAYTDMSVEGFLKFTASIRGLRGQAGRDAVEKALDTCHLQGVRRQSIDTLSKGYFHRTCFAQAILHDPPILILDEPTDGLDPNQKHEMRELIKTMGKTKAIIVSTHILEEVEAICTRAIIIDCGKLVFNGTPAELRSRSAEAGCVTVGLLNVSAAEATPALEKVDGVKTVTLLSEENGRALYRLAGDKGRTGLAASLKAFLDGKHWNFDELHTNQGRLDDVFHTITSTDSAKEVHK